VPVAIAESSEMFLSQRLTASNVSSLPARSLSGQQRIVVVSSRDPGMVNSYQTNNGAVALSGQPTLLTSNNSLMSHLHRPQYKLSPLPTA
jgi:hypothetical protein